MTLLKDKVVLVTGGSKGIGKAIVERMVTEGAKVAFTYLSSAESALAMETELKAKGGEVLAIQSNAAEFDAAQALVDKVVEQFGSLDVLINNAGITDDNLILRMSEASFDKVIDINLKSVFNTIKAASRTFMKQRSGSIINMTSVVGIKGNAGQANYAASKAGIIGLTKSVALEFGSRNIRCNAIAPGFIETEMTAKLDEKMVQSWRDGIPMKRGGKPEDVADACVFLGSSMSSYVSGQVLQVDGGMLT